MAHWLKELRALINRDPDEGPDLTDLNSALHSMESDRGCALLAGSLAENVLEQMIRMRLVTLSNERRQELFGAEGVMRSFSSKIRVAHAFGVIDDELRKDFDRVREIRNVFAHSRRAVTFKTAAVMRACAGFDFTLSGSLAGSYWDMSDPRHRYLRAIFALMNVATLAMARKLRGHTRMLTRPLSYDEPPPWFDRSMRRQFQQTLEDLHSDGKKPTQKAPPEASRP